MYRHLKSLFILIHSSLLLVLSSCQVSVTLPTGNYIGERVTTYSDEHYLSFKGIKFATAQRFKEGVLMADGSETYNATNFGPACYQDRKTFHLGLPVVSEDCLYLNVYTPHLGGKLPVMVYIHGGDFIIGGTSLNSPDYFMETGRIVVVTITYRLSVFGFVYFDDAKHPANLGLRDQILALKWVKKYIKYFGGDPSRVTLNGESAGSASINILMYSPMAKGLFIGGIGESGVSSGRWTLQPRCTGLQRRDMLAKEAGCENHIPHQGGGADELVKCLMQKSPEEILEAVRKFPIQFHPAPFPPTVEQKTVRNPVISFFPWLKRTGPSEIVPWITGINSNEGLSLVGDTIKGSYNNLFVSIGVNLFADFILPDLMLYKYLAKSPFVATHTLKLHYERLIFSNITELGIEVVTSGFFDYPLVRSLLPVQSPTYVYYFNFTQPHQHAGVGHGGELPYIWPNPNEVYYIRGNEEYSNLSKFMVNTWIAFAYHQFPNIPDVTWDRYDYNKDRVLIIDNSGVKMASNPTKDKTDIWKTVEIDTSPKMNNCPVF